VGAFLQVRGQSEKSFVELGCEKGLPPRDVMEFAHRLGELGAGCLWRWNAARPVVLLVEFVHRVLVSVSLVFPFPGE